jgi:spermidine/putrescine transport system permease protein
VLLAFALENAWGSVLGGAGNVWWLIVLSQATLALPFVIPTLLLSLRTISPGPRQAAELLGAHPFSAYLEMDLPRARAGVITAALLAFVIGLGEFTATLFLATPTFTTLPVAYYHLDALREPAAAGACAALLLLVSAAVLVALSFGGRRVVV